jgi:hypothetical protein
LVVILWLLTGMRGLGFLLADIAAASSTIHVVLVISNQGCEKNAIEESTRANCKFRWLGRGHRAYLGDVKSCLLTSLFIRRTVTATYFLEYFNQFFSHKSQLRCLFPGPKSNPRCRILLCLTWAWEALDNFAPILPVLELFAHKFD